MDGIGLLPLWNGCPTEDEVTDYCLRLDPPEAAIRRDAALCVTPIVTEMQVDGESIKLEMKGGRWLAIVVRVSGDRQRSSKAPRRGTKRKETTKSRHRSEAYSEEEQVRRSIRYAVEHRICFAVYSDAGIRGSEYPLWDNDQLHRVLAKKATRYRLVLEKTLLDTASLARRTPDEIASIRQYIDKRVREILASSPEEAMDFSSKEEKELFELRTERLLRGRPRRKVQYRWALTVLWSHVTQNLIHTVAASDRSRICRDADLETAFLQLLFEHGTRVVGLIEDMSSMDVSDPLNKGLNYLIASVHEKRLTEIAQAAIRGNIQRLECGSPPSGNMPWWLRKGPDGKAELDPEKATIARKAIDYYVSGLGLKAIARRLHDEGDRVDGAILTEAKLFWLVHSKTAVLGYFFQFGLRWDSLPPLLDETMYAELEHRRSIRKNDTGWWHPHNWSEHTFAGLIRCQCGLTLTGHKEYRKGSRLGHKGFYYCRRRNYEDPTGLCRHSKIDVQRLEEFFAELMSAHPQLIRESMIVGDGTTSSIDRQAKTALLENKLGDMENRLRDLEIISQVHATKTALSIGICPDSPGYQSIISGLVANDTKAIREEIDQTQAELTRTRIEISQSARRDDFFSSLDSLADWDGLNAYQRNRLLSAIISRIEIAGTEDTKKLTIYLNGISTPLHPVWLCGVNRRSMRFPTIAEWIDSMVTGEPPRTAVFAPRTDKMRCVGQCRDELCWVEGAEELWAFCRSHKIRLSSPVSLNYYVKHLSLKGADDNLVDTMKRVYLEFVEIERRRMEVEVSLPDQ